MSAAEKLTLAEHLAAYEKELEIVLTVKGMSRYERRKRGIYVKTADLQAREGVLADLIGGVRDALNGGNV